MLKVVLTVKLTNKKNRVTNYFKKKFNSLEMNLKDTKKKSSLTSHT